MFVARLPAAQFGDGHEETVNKWQIYHSRFFLI